MFRRCQAPCNEGTFNFKTAQTKCNKCPQGWYQDQKGQSSCKICNNFCPNEESIVDSECPENYICYGENIQLWQTQKAEHISYCNSSFDCQQSDKEIKTKKRYLHNPKSGVYRIKKDDPTKYAQVIKLPDSDDPNYIPSYIEYFSLDDADNSAKQNEKANNLNSLFYVKNVDDHFNIIHPNGKKLGARKTSKLHESTINNLSICSSSYVLESKKKK